MDDQAMLGELLPVVEIERTPRTTLAVRMPQQADNDAGLIRLWLHGRSPATTTAYRAGVAAFLAFVGGKPLHQVRLSDLHDFQDSLAQLRPASIAAKLAGLKSLFSFAHDLGYLPVNVGRVLKLPPVNSRRRVKHINPRLGTTMRLIAAAVVLASIAGSAHAAPLRCPAGSSQWADGWGNRTCQATDPGHATVFTEPHVARPGDGYGAQHPRAADERDGGYYAPPLTFSR